MQVSTSTAWNSGSGYVSVEDMIEFSFLDIPDLSNVQQDGFGPLSVETDSQPPIGCRSLQAE